MTPGFCNFDWAQLHKQKPYLSDKGLLVYNDWLASEADR
jgi:hypothetical protein